jgi:zinc-ribbon domain
VPGVVGLGLLALISCPECGHQVSDQALVCPSCGHPLQQAASVSDLLLGRQWRARSGTLLDAMLEATFNEDGTFAGRTVTDQARIVPGAIPTITPGEVQGTWTARGPELYLDFPLTMMGNPSPTQIAISFHEISADRLVGVDTWSRPWEMDRIG